MEATNYEGVDVILNSLSGELLAESWRCLGAYGRFIEIGKRDLIMSGNLNLNGFTGSKTYAAVDLAQDLEQRDEDTMRYIQFKGQSIINGIIPVNDGLTVVA